MVGGITGTINPFALSKRVLVWGWITYNKRSVNCEHYKAAAVDVAECHSMRIAYIAEVFQNDVINFFVECHNTSFYEKFHVLQMDELH